MKMTGRVYLRAIVPIGLFFSLSLICGNLTYLYLSVSFIQMLKATMPVAVLLVSWALGTAQPNFKVLFNVSFIVIGVVIASFGEIDFVLIGFLYQCGGIVFEAIRLVMVQRLLSSAEFKMDPLVSLYYFAPVCAIMNFVVALFWEIPDLKMADIYAVGITTLFANAGCAFLLNVSVVFLVRMPFLRMNEMLTRTIDWKDLWPCSHPLRCPEGYSPRRRLYAYLGNRHHPSPMLRLQHCARWSCLLQAWGRNIEGLHL